jgi:hypothetical protein
MALLTAGVGRPSRLEPAAYNPVVKGIAPGDSYQTIVNFPILTHHSVSAMYPALPADVSAVNCHKPLKPR